MNFVFADTLDHLVNDHDTVTYLTDKSRIRDWRMATRIYR